MKTHWTDQELEGALKGLKDAPTGERFWSNRVWDGIASALPEEARKLLQKPWYRRPAVVRLGLAAACLTLAMGWWKVQSRSADSEISEYLSSLAEPVNITALEPENRIAPDLLRAGLVDSKDAAAPESEMEVLYDDI